MVLNKNEWPEQWPVNGSSAIEAKNLLRHIGKLRQQYAQSHMVVLKLEADLQEARESRAQVVGQIQALEGIASMLPRGDNSNGGNSNEE